MSLLVEILNKTKSVLVLSMKQGAFKRHVNEYAKRVSCRNQTAFILKSLQEITTEFPIAFVYMKNQTK